MSQEERKNKQGQKRDGSRPQALHVVNNSYCTKVNQQTFHVSTGWSPKVLTQIESYLLFYKIFQAKVHAPVNSA